MKRIIANNPRLRGALHGLCALLLLCMASPCWGEENPELFLKGVKAYEKGDYTQAASAWSNLATEEPYSSEVAYNLGNAYYRMEEWGPCILWYERALKMAPGDRDTKENLALAYSKTEDQIETIPQFFLVRWWNGYVALHGVRGWFVTCMMMMVLACACWAAFMLARRFSTRKILLIVSALLSAGLFFSILGASFSLSRASIHNEAVVMSPVCVVKSSPDRGGVDKYVLHEGTKLHIEETSTEWSKVRMSDGNGGWCESADIEVI